MSRLGRGDVSNVPFGTGGHIQCPISWKQDNVKDATHLRVKKAYPAYFGSYKDFPKVKDYLDSYENLFCIGRNGQHRYNNMDHSMLTAMEAVNLIKTGNTKDKSILWQVNTEKEYHEEKAAQ